MNPLSVIIGVALFLGGVATSAAEKSAPPSVNSVVYILASLLAGSVATAAVNLYKAKKIGSAQGEQLIASAMHEAVSAAQVMLVQYREDLARANQTKVELTDILVKRNAAIVKLEQDLVKTNGEKALVKKEYEDSVTKLAVTKAELTKCREVQENLQLKVTALEAVVQKGKE